MKKAPLQSGFSLLLLVVTLLAAVPVSVQAQGAGDQSINEAEHNAFVFAYRLFQRGQTEQSVRAFEDFIEQYPQSKREGDARYFLALAAKQQGDIKRCQAELDKIKQTALVDARAVTLLRSQLALENEKFDDAAGYLRTIDSKGMSDQSKATVAFLTGLAERGRGNHKQAVAPLQAAYASDTDLSEKAGLALTDSLRQTGKQAEAYKIATALAGSHQPAIAAQAGVVASRLAFDAKDYDKAINFARSVVENYPQQVEAYRQAVVQLAWALLEAGRHDAVIDMREPYAKVLSADQVTELDAVAAYAYQRKGQPKQAIDILSTIIKEKPGWSGEAQVLLHLMECQLAVNDEDAAKQTFNKLEKSYADVQQYASAVLLLVSLDEVTGKLEGSIRRLTGIIDKGKKHPAYREALLERARLYELQNITEQALADYRAFLDKNQEDDRQRTVLLRMASLLIDEGESQQAVRMLEPLAKKDAGREATFLLAEAYRAAKQFDLASKAYTQVIQSDSGASALLVAESHYWLGLIAMGADRADDAVNYLTQAGTSDALEKPKRANALRLAAGVWLARDQQNDKAIALLEKLADLIDADKLQQREALVLARHWIASAEDRPTLLKAARLIEPLLRPEADLPAKTKAEAAFLEAWRLDRLQENDKAMKAYRAVIELALPASIDARMNLARLLNRMGEGPEALKQYRKLIAMSNQVEGKVIARALWEAADIHEAMAFRALRNEQDAVAAERLRDAEQQLLQITLTYDAPEYSPFAQHALLRLIDISERLGEPKDVEMYARDLQKKFADSDYARFGQALLDWQQGKVTAALKSWRAINENTDDAYLREHCTNWISRASRPRN